MGNLKNVKNKMRLFHIYFHNEGVSFWIKSTSSLNINKTKNGKVLKIKIPIL